MIVSGGNIPVGSSLVACLMRDGPLSREMCGKYCGYASGQYGCFISGIGDGSKRSRALLIRGGENGHKWASATMVVMP